MAEVVPSLGRGLSLHGDAERALSNRQFSSREKKGAREAIKRHGREFWANLTADCPPPPRGASRGVLGVHSLVASGGFQIFMLCAVFVQAIVAALDAPIYMQATPASSSGLPGFTNTNRVYTYYVIAGAVDLVVTFIYVVEIMLKMIAFGGKQFFKSSWNILDFIVTIASIVDSVILGPFGLIRLTAASDRMPFVFRLCRGLRAVRPLQAIRYVGGVKDILTALVESMTTLASVVIFLAFFLVFFSVIGVELYGNSLARRCVTAGDPSVTFIPDVFCKCNGFNGIDYYNLTVSNVTGAATWTNVGPTSEMVGLVPRYFEQFCTNTRCNSIIGANASDEEAFCDSNYGSLNYGITHFDNFAAALLTVFQISTLDGWAQEIMHPMMMSEGDINFIYFILVIIFLSYLTVNLFVAVITDTFGRVRASRRDVSELDTEWIAVEKTAVKTAGMLKAAGKFLKVKTRASFQKRSGCLKFRDKVAKFVRTRAFSMSIDVCIALNFVILALEFEGMESLPAFMMFMAITEIVFTAIFDLEMLLKFVGLGQKYFRSASNIFDFIINIVTTLSLVLDYIPSINSIGINLQMLRVFRLFRLVRLLRQFPRLRRIVGSIVLSLPATFQLLIFLFFYLMLFSLLGMQLFGVTRSDLFPADCTTVVNNGIVALNNGTCMYPHRWNFGTWAESMLLLFQVLTGDMWSNVLFDTMNSMGEDNWMRYVAPVYFVTYFIFAGYGVMNLYIAIVLENFSLEDQLMKLNKEGDELDELLNKTLNETGQMKAMQPGGGRDKGAAGKKDDEKKNGKEEVAAKKSAANVSKVVPFNGDVETGAKKEDEKNEGDAKAEENKNESRADSRVDSRADSKAESEGGSKKGIRALCLYNHSLFCLPEGNKFRRAMKKTVESTPFEIIILIVIIISSGSLAMEDHYQRERQLLQTIFSILDLVYLAVFAIEFVFKVIAYGFILHKGSYLRSTAWNWLDFIVLAAMVIDAMPFASDFTLLRLVRNARVFRPLKMVRKFKRMRIVLNALVGSLPSLTNVALLMLAIYLIFGILGLNLFRGKFFFCNDDSVIGKIDCLGVYDHGEGYLVPKIWANPSENFDHVGSAFLTLFEVATLKWTGVMHAAMDIDSKGLQPRRNATMSYSIFFVLFVLVSLMGWNLFIAVVIENFNMSTGSSLMTEDQKRWVDIQKFMMTAKPQRDEITIKNKFRRACRYLVEKKWFNHFITTVLILNVLLMGATYYENPDERFWMDIAEMIDYGFIALYFIEMVIKLGAFNVKGYFRSNWHKFEFVIVLLSIASIGLRFVVTTVAMVTVLVKFVSRLARIARVFRLVQRAKSLRILFSTVLLSLPSIGNVMLLMMIIYYVFAVIGMQLFTDVRFQTFHNKKANFRTFPSAFLTLFQMSAGDDWMFFMHELMNTRDCTPKEEAPASLIAPYSDCGSSFAWLYFILFYILVVFIFSQLFVGVIMDNFGFCYNIEKALVSKDDFNIFSKTWYLFDENTSGTFPIRRLHSFIYILDGSLGERNHLHVRRMVYQTKREMRIQAKRRITRRRTRFGGGVGSPMVEIPEDECEFYSVLRLLCLNKLGEGSLTSEAEKERYLRDYDECLKKAACDYLGQVWKRFRARAPSTIGTTTVVTDADGPPKKGKKEEEEEEEVETMSLAAKVEPKATMDSIVAVMRRRDEIRRLQNVVLSKVLNPVM
eukprot:CAMPEP_0113871966 /NCGR_PEP_ID=MMETSP0780_2-20120614/2938_1 /TAXON_ID=652834 /ORGANISM="Palpitomonas bilix" /LENGTH=1686 /DNA_ID=CAMNT_0000857419 /DNA_START=328 /DNA_END=5388 /DNA_ORIENTATION=- /assembly_acc=CAM_ASM_000599